jgi:transposase
MRGRKSKLTIEIEPATREKMEALLRAQKTEAGLARRVRGILLLERDQSFIATAQQIGMSQQHLRKWAKRFVAQGLEGLEDKARSGRRPFFPPEVALHTVKMACELPDLHGCSFSQWDCEELARQLVSEGIVTSISRETVRRILYHHKLKPWRFHLWLSPKVPRDAKFVETVRMLVVLYSRELEDWEMVLCVDEKTSLQPRPRLAKTLPTEAGKPMRVEHEYKRVGALNLFAGFDTRSGKVYSYTAPRKRQVEFIAFLEQLEREIPTSITKIYIVLDNLKMHKGKQVVAWLEKHPRFIFQHPPVHCSWMNQVEQWFSILQRKRLRIANFANTEELAQRLEAFVGEWNERAHPFQWNSQSAEKVIAKYEQKVALSEGGIINESEKKPSVREEQSSIQIEPKVLPVQNKISVQKMGATKPCWSYALAA